MIPIPQHLNLKCKNFTKPTLLCRHLLDRFSMISFPQKSTQHYSGFLYSFKDPRTNDFLISLFQKIVILVERLQEITKHLIAFHFLIAKSLQINSHQRILRCGLVFGISVEFSLRYIRTSQIRSNPIIANVNIKLYSIRIAIQLPLILLYKQLGWNNLGQ